MSKFPSADAIASMVNSVTITMMNVRFALSPTTQNIAAYRRAVLPIPGKVPVVVVVMGDEASCQKLGARLFSMDPADVDVSMMEDTLRELANITAGQVKRAMSIDSALGLPRIIVGNEPWGRPDNALEPIYLRADSEDIRLEVQVVAAAT